VSLANPDLAIHAGSDAWTVRARLGSASATVTGEPDLMSAILRGSRSGVEAFLEGRLEVRGHLSLALQLESLMEGTTRAVRSPHAERVRAAGVDSFFIEIGAGPPVIVLHGLGATGASMLPLIWELSRDHRVIAPDLPGMGESGKPIRAYTAEFFSRWLHCLLDELEIPRAVIAGNSLGGRIAIEMALREPGRVEGIVLLAPSPARSQFRRLGVPLVRLLRPEAALLPIPLPRQVRDAARSMFARPGRLSEVWWDAAVEEFLRVFRDPRARIAFFSAMREIYLEEPDGDLGFWRRLSDLRRPALFIWGRQDPLISWRNADRVARSVPHARSIVLDDCGHVPQFELPELTNALVRDFLSSIGA